MVSVALDMNQEMNGWINEREFNDLQHLLFFENIGINNNNICAWSTVGTAYSVCWLAKLIPGSSPGPQGGPKYGHCQHIQIKLLAEGRSKGTMAIQDLNPQSSDYMANILFSLPVSQGGLLDRTQWSEKLNQYILD